MGEYIGISEDRLHHMIGVARKAYSIAEEMGYDEEFCREMFMLGWIHDVGYEFSEDQTDHPKISGEMLESIGASDEAVNAVKRHGSYPDDKNDIRWKILDMADMLIDSKGREVTVSERLLDIRKRYNPSRRESPLL